MCKGRCTREALASHNNKGSGLGKLSNVTTIAVVSVNRSYDSSDAFLPESELRSKARGNWFVSLAKARRVEILIAAYQGFCVGAWRVDGVSLRAPDEINSRTQADKVFHLKEPLAVNPYFSELAQESVGKLRSGIRIVESD